MPVDVDGVIGRLSCLWISLARRASKAAGVVWSPTAWAHLEPASLVLLCKRNHCLAQDPRWKGWPWTPFDVFLVYLGHNVGMDQPGRRRDAERRAHMRAAR